MKTFSAKPLEVERKWYLIDANGATLGRLAVEVANILRGKNKPQFTPNVDTGDFVVVINADKIQIFRNKALGKLRSLLAKHHLIFLGINFCYKHRLSKGYAKTLTLTDGVMDNPLVLA